MPGAGINDQFALGAAMSSHSFWNENFGVGSITLQGPSDAVIAWNDLQGGQGPTNHNNQSSWGKRVKLYNCFPIDVGELQLSYDNVDQFSEFPVTFAYDYWDYVGADGSAQTTGADSAQSSGQQSGLAPRR